MHIIVPRGEQRWAWRQAAVRHDDDLLHHGVDLGHLLRGEPRVLHRHVRLQEEEEPQHLRQVHEHQAYSEGSLWLGARPGANQI